ncbi:MAG TPA: orotate phosphoribosyltransferase [bacterium]|nr:orotate phosphoribosyltransferase [bacterium]
MYDPKIKNELLAILQKESVIHKKVTLSSGKTSNYYVDGKMTTLNRDGIYLIAKLFAPLMKDVQAVGGPTMGADPFIGAILYECKLQNIPTVGFIVRKDVKAHGTMKMVEGPLVKGMEVAVVEDVITTGGSVLKAITAIEEYGCKVKKVLSLLDREESGSDTFAAKGYPFYPVFKKGELILPV